MNPQHYVDIEIRGSESGGGFPRPVLAGAILRALHGAFRKHPGKFALALPGSPFTALRVFAEGREDLDTLHEEVGTHPAVRDYGRFGYPQNVPSDYKGPWKRYARFRIPTRKADRSSDSRLRRARLEKAGEDNLPFFPMHSNTSGQSFSLHVEVQDTSGPLEECLPDSYGLSVASRPFALPDV